MHGLQHAVLASCVVSRQQRCIGIGTAGVMSATHLVRAASRDEDALFTVLLKVPGLNAILYLQLLQMLAAQVEGLQQQTHL